LRAQTDFINKDTDGEQQHAARWGKKERKKKKRDKKKKRRPATLFVNLMEWDHKIDIPVDR
jgi:hypothetical protein